MQTFSHMAIHPLMVSGRITHPCMMHVDGTTQLRSGTVKFLSVHTVHVLDDLQYLHCIMLAQSSRWFKLIGWLG